MNTTLLRMFIIHHDNEVADDRIIISRVAITPTLAEPMFRLEFTTTMSGGERVTYRSHMNRERIENYIHSLLKSLRADDDPFKSIQVSSSIYPSIMYEIENLGWEDRENIMNIIMATLANNVTRLRSDS